MKTSLGNLSINLIDGHLIKVNNTNLGITEPYKIIVNSKITTLIAYWYEDMSRYIYLLEMQLHFY